MTPGLCIVWGGLLVVGGLIGLVIFLIRIICYKDYQKRHHVPSIYDLNKTISTKELDRDIDKIIRKG
jgi:hypothetical protein